MCEACERAPAAFLCKADAASLCSSCDADIHSANPLASRHHRVPILPISGSLFGEPEHERVYAFVNEVEAEEEEEEVFDEYDEVEAASWLLPHPMKNDKIDENGGDEGFLFGDEYFDNLVDCNSCGHNNNQFSNVYDQHQQNYSNTVPQNYAVVPVQVPQHFQPGLDFDSSKAGFSYDGSLSQSVSYLLFTSVFLFGLLFISMGFSLLFFFFLFANSLDHSSIGLYYFIRFCLETYANSSF